MPFSTTNKAAYQQQMSSSLLPLGRKKLMMTQSRRQWGLLEA